MSERHCDFLQPAFPRRPRAKAPQQMRDHEFNPFLPDQVWLSGCGMTEKMDHIASLRIVPPAQEFHFDSELLQRRFGLLDLNLKTTMREKKGIQVIEKHAHRKLPIDLSGG